MLFNSYIFIFVFFPLTFATYFLSSKYVGLRMSLFLMAFASIIFYGYFNPWYIWIILASIIVNYVVGIGIDSSAKRGNAKVSFYMCTFGVLFNIGLLGFYKYTDFIIFNLNSVLPVNIPLQHIALPLGISFFTFQQVAYLVDIYRGDIHANKDIGWYSTFVAFFPQLIAGPIVLYKTMAPQFHEPEKHIINYENISRGVFIFTIGLFKKIMLADTMSVYVSSVFKSDVELNIISSWCASLASMFQMYFDFSGYCDMAIGLGLIFNIALPINFMSPLKSANIREFWQTWHMTMMVFIRNYVFFPLGGSKKGEFRTYLNIFVIMIVVGVWHGASWIFVVWGLLHGIASIIHRYLAKHYKPLPRRLGVFITFIFLIFMSVVFTSPNFTRMGYIAGCMLDITSLLDINYNFLSAQKFIEEIFFPIHINFERSMSLIVLGLSFFLVFMCPNSIQLKDRFKPDYKHLLFTIVMLMVSLISLNKESEFLYFNF